MGAFDSFGRSLDKIFEKRSPWPALVFKARHSTLLKAASTPKVQAALAAICRN